MAGSFENDEPRALREAIERLSERVDAIENVLIEKPDKTAGTPPSVEEPLTSAPVGQSEKALPRAKAAAPKISYPPPPSQLELPHLWKKKSWPEQWNFSRLVGNESWESVVGERWLTWLGSASLILAVAYFVPWAWRHFQLPAWFRVLVFHLAGIGILGVAKILSRKQLPQLAQGVTGLGIFTLYTAAYAWHHHYHLGGELSSTLAFVDCALITALAIVIALRYDNVAVIVLGGLGGYLTPWIASSGGGEYVVTFVYLAFLNIALLVCATLRPWQFLKPLAVAATVVMFLRWMFDSHFDSSMPWGTEWLLVLHAAIFFFGINFPSLRWRQSSVGADSLALAGNSLWFVGATWLLFHLRSEQQLAAVCWGMSALHVALFAWTYRSVTNADRLPRLHLALSIVFFTLAVPLQLRDSLDYLAYAWAAEGLVFTAIAVYFGDQRLARAGHVVLGLAIAKAVIFDYPASPEAIGFLQLDRRFLVMLCSGLAAMLAGSSYWWKPRLLPARKGVASLDREEGAILIAIGNVVAMVGLTCQWDSRLVLVLWIVDAALIWGAGLYFGSRSAQVYALLLSLIMVGGRVLYHGPDVETPSLCLINARFGTLALVALLYFVPAWVIRTGPTRGAPKLTETVRGVPVLLHVLANVVLFTAFSLEVHDWYRPVGNWLRSASTAEQVTYSVVWTIYAGVLVAVGFGLKYRLPRMMGLLGFLLVSLKVFFVDLANLPLILRVLALAAFGGTLLLTSFWYQKFSERLKSES